MNKHILFTYSILIDDYLCDFINLTQFYLAYIVVQYTQFVLSLVNNSVNPK